MFSLMNNKNKVYLLNIKYIKDINHEYNEISTIKWIKNALK